MGRIKVIRQQQQQQQNQQQRRRRHRRRAKIDKSNILSETCDGYEGVLTRSKKRLCQKLQEQQQQQNEETQETSSRLLELPVEIQLKIMGYLGCRDLEALRRTSKRLESIAMHPSLWKEYEILNDNTEVIGNLKRMSLLKKIVIRNRIDTNDIVRQISLSNKQLEELHIAYKFWDLPIFLRPDLMTRLVERCQRLHTISLDGVYCRSLKLYRLLGKKVFGNLRSLNVKMTMGQIRAFVSHLNEQSRDNVYKSLRELGPRYWKVVRYLRCSDLRAVRKANNTQ